MKIAANLHPNAPCNQPFDRKAAAAAQGKPNKKLSQRIDDYARMVDDPKFKSTGYHMPGSNKK